MTGSSINRQSLALATLPERSFARATSPSWLNTTAGDSTRKQSSRVRRALLIAVGLADRTVPVEDELLDRTALPDQVHLVPRHLHKRGEVLRMAQDIGLEAAQLTGR